MLRVEYVIKRVHQVLRHAAFAAESAAVATKRLATRILWPAHGASCISAVGASLLRKFAVHRCAAHPVLAACTARLHAHASWLRSLRKLLLSMRLILNVLLICVFFSLDSLAMLLLLVHVLLHLITI